MADPASVGAYLKPVGEAVITIFAIVNPIGNLPVFVGLTEDATATERRHLFRLATAAALGIILVMALAGDWLLRHVFHISMEEFAFAGGLLLIAVGIRNMLSPANRRKDLSQSNDDHAERLLTQQSLAITPIAIPMLVGPGSIVNVMLVVNRNGRLVAALAVLGAFAGVFLVLHCAHLLYRLTGRLGALALGRTMQIFIIAVGVKFCVDSLQVLFPALVGTP